LNEWEMHAMHKGGMTGALLSPACGNHQIRDQQKQDTGEPNRHVPHDSFCWDFRRSHVARETHPAAHSCANTSMSFHWRWRWGHLATDSLDATLVHFDGNRPLKQRRRENKTTGIFLAQQDSFDVSQRSGTNSNSITATQKEVRFNSKRTVQSLPNRFDFRPGNRSRVAARSHNLANPGHRDGPAELALQSTSHENVAGK